jgi:hypothetical protein
MGLRSHYRSSRALGRQRRNRRLFMEALEPRLALTWAGVPPVSITPPDILPVVLNANGDATGSASIASTEVDYYKVIATAAGSFTFSTATPSSNLDTVIGVFSATGQRITYNDDNGNSSDSRVTANLAAGTYFLGVTNYSSTSRGAYNYTIDYSPLVPQTDDLYEQNDTFTAAFDLRTLSATRAITGLKLTDSADWYKFTTVATGTSTSTVTLSFTHSQGDLQLTLYNSAGFQMGSSVGTGNTETVTLKDRAAGTYYVRVTGNAGVTNPDYTLTVNAPPTPPPGSGFSITLAISGLTASQTIVFNQAAARWAQIITGDLPNATYQGQTVDDVLIAASAVPIDGVNGILGQAAPDAFRTGSQLPYHGFMEFDTADLASLESEGDLMAVILHEMGHVLGVGTIWSRLGLLQGRGTANPTFIGAQATAAYNTIFATIGSGVPVENSGGGGTRDAHWRETTFSSELMTGFLNSGVLNPISRVTVASLADMGYTVNLTMADAYSPPTGGGSQLVQPTGGGSFGSSSYYLVGTDTEASHSLMQSWIPLRWDAVDALPVRRSALVAPTTRFDEDVTDAAVTVTFQQRGEELWDDVLVRDKLDSAEREFAWEDFELARNDWSLSAL